MQNNLTLNLLKAAGIAGGILTAGAVAYFTFMGIKNYYEVKKLKLEIQTL